jgi:hypothetical protein
VALMPASTDRLPDVRSLIAEIERLRIEVADERSAVVAYLRDEANTPHPTETDEYALPFNMRFLLLASAIQIELGEHRKDGEP